MSIVFSTNHIFLHAVNFSDQVKDKIRRYAVVSQWWKNTGVLIIGYESYQALVMQKKNDENNDSNNKLREPLLTPGINLY